jgi:hypothetical protein
MKKIINKLFILFLLFSGISVFANDPIGNPGDGFNGGDPGSVAPINDYIIPMLLVVLVFGYRVLIVKKKVLTPTSF